MGFNNLMESCNHYHNQDTEQSQHNPPPLQMSPGCHFIVRPTSLTLSMTGLFSIPIVLHFPECQIKGTI